jgi:hypothetical protein
VASTLGRCATLPRKGGCDLAAERVSDLTEPGRRVAMAAIEHATSSGQGGRDHGEWWAYDIVGVGKRGHSC